MEPAPVDHPIHEPLARRWSPYAFSPRPVPERDLLSLFEAARWAPSSYNEQPWHYLVARRENEAEFERMLSCLWEPNQRWARHAPVLALGVVRLFLSRNQQPNRAAHHDLGLASENLVIEATVRGLCVHQMIGVEPERARELYGIPEGHEVLTGLAIGYAAPPDEADPELAERDRARRPRKPLSQFVFGGSWGRTAPFVPGS